MAPTSKCILDIFPKLLLVIRCGHLRDTIGLCVSVCVGGYEEKKSRRRSSSLSSSSYSSPSPQPSCPFKSRACYLNNVPCDIFHIEFFVRFVSSSSLSLSLSIHVTVCVFVPSFLLVCRTNTNTFAAHILKQAHRRFAIPDNNSIYVMSFWVSIAH